MLDTDMCLLYKSNLKMASCLKAGSITNSCTEYAKSGEALSATKGNCCAWVDDKALFKSGVFKTGSSNFFCGTNITSTINTGKE